MDRDFVNRNLKEGKTIVFDNERTFEDDFFSADCSLRNEERNTWVNGFQIYFNGKLFSFKTFDAFFKKLIKLKNNYNLELKSW